MPVTRADAISRQSKQIIVYSDFPNNFTKHPITNELVAITNENSVKQAFKNLILTNVGERLFNPFFGTNINKSLFDLDSPFLTEDIIRYVTVSAVQFEPRVNVTSVIVDNQTDTNTVYVTITFIIINISEPVTVKIPILRIR